MSRTRSTTYVDTIQGPFYWDGYHNNGTFQGRYITSSFNNLDTKTIVDELTPDYYSKLASGEFLPINPTTITSYKQELISAHSGEMRFKVPGGSTPQYLTGGHTGWYAGTSLPDPAVSTADIDAVVIKALASAKQADFDVTTFIGEFHQTTRLLGDTMGKFFHIARRVATRAKRKEIRKSRRSKRPFSDKQVLKNFYRYWLEARYGWRPLVYDIQALLSLLREKSQNDLARKNGSLSKSVAASATSANDLISVKYTGSIVRSGSMRYYATVFYSDRMTRIGANPIITAYELTRFSFIVDWFVNIGAWIQAVSPREGYDQIGISVSTVEDWVTTYTQTAEEGSGHQWYVGVGTYSYKRYMKRYTRWSYTGIPLPSIQINLSPAKIIDLIALALSGRDSVHYRMRR